MYVKYQISPTPLISIFHTAAKHKKNMKPLIILRWKDMWLHARDARYKILISQIKISQIRAI